MQTGNPLASSPLPTLPGSSFGTQDATTRPSTPAWRKSIVRRTVRVPPSAEDRSAPRQEPLLRSGDGRGSEALDRPAWPDELGEAGSSYEPDRRPPDADRPR